MKKTVYTLCVDQYMPDLCALTLPNHAEYAERIGADFQIITKRWYPGWHPTYEKLQIYDLGQNNDWNIHIDADILIHPSLRDVTEGSLPWQIRWYSIYDASLYFACDRYFARDQRKLGVCSSFLAVPSLCHEIWKPFSCSYEEALKGINKPHGIDDYCFSRNFAKYGLKGDFIFSEGDDTNWIQHLEVGGCDCPKEREMEIVQKAEKILFDWRKEQKADVT